MTITGVTVRHKRYAQRTYDPIHFLYCGLRKFSSAEAKVMLRH